ncbi:hypothetical protein LVY65_05320 [Sphingomonas sp. G124]|uniref:Uncharacterized protein n=1 Tax=Sphingomonas cremea TaxID=2904799 RepID=A0A9X1QJ62_9SPHN|nr:hypothetical protein [Sphingomonas cremea]MCF2514486.1 hypothetical protein [Sphingomonas cremea]
MDIIAAHQHGLIEQLEADAAALAGRARDHGQRTVVLHHLYDHARGSHGWALGEARQGLRIAAGLEALGKRIERWGWMTKGRDEARAGLNLLAEALGEAARSRTEAAYRAYRLSATAALRCEAETNIPPGLLALLDRCHSARRAGEYLSVEEECALAEESERFAAATVDMQSIEDAWTAVSATALGRAARRLVGAKVLSRHMCRDKRRGWARVERQLRNETTLPPSFRANPAQHFYALQHMLQERRRQQWREACDREPGAFELAA